MFYFKTTVDQLSNLGILAQFSLQFNPNHAALLLFGQLPGKMVGICSEHPNFKLLDPVLLNGIIQSIVRNWDYAVMVGVLMAGLAVCSSDTFPFFWCLLKIKLSLLVKNNIAVSKAGCQNNQTLGCSFISQSHTQQWKMHVRQAVHTVVRSKSIVLWLNSAPGKYKNTSFI